jgi:hypothetical protein
MSLIAASLTKSAVVGLIPSVEFTPVFSATVSAKADVEINSVATVIVNVVFFMSRIFAFFCYVRRMNSGHAAS